MDTNKVSTFRSTVLCLAAIIAVTVVTFAFATFSERNDSNTDSSTDTASVQGVANNDSGGNSEDQQESRVYVDVNNGKQISKYVYEIEPNGEVNAKELLTELEARGVDFAYETEETEIGSFITTVNGTIADPNSEYWKIRVNGEDAQVGISELQLKQGDHLSLVITKF
jgi:ABC-type lipoprotein release transport system permease subunit